MCCRRCLPAACKLLKYLARRLAKPRFAMPMWTKNTNALHAKLNCPCTWCSFLRYVRLETPNFADRNLLRKRSQGSHCGSRFGADPSLPRLRCGPRRAAYHFHAASDATLFAVTGPAGTTVSNSVGWAGGFVRGPSHFWKTRSD